MSLLINHVFEDKHLCGSLMPFFFLVLFFFVSFIQDIIRPLENPIKKTGHLQILYGNLAPKGSVAKITGKEGLYFSGAVFCYLFNGLVKLYFFNFYRIQMPINCRILEILQVLHLSLKERSQ